MNNQYTYYGVTLEKRLFFATTPDGSPLLAGVEKSYCLFLSKRASLLGDISKIARLLGDMPSNSGEESDQHGIGPSGLDVRKRFCDCDDDFSATCWPVHSRGVGSATMPA